jgi:hypothetical protein
MQQALRLEEAHMDAARAVELSAAALNVASGLASWLEISNTNRSQEGADTAEARERQRRELDLRICVYGAPYENLANAWSLLRRTFISSCGFASGFVEVVMQDVAACRTSQLQRNTTAGVTLWVTFKNESAKQACWKSRHIAAQYSSSRGQGSVRFTQSLTEQQRQDVDSFKVVMNLAADMGRR